MIDPRKVHETLDRHQLADGMPIVLDLEKSTGTWLHDSRSGANYFDAFTCFASWPLGYNHPKMVNDAEFNAEILIAGRNKPSNSDLYTVEMAKFVEAFATHVTPEGFPHHFWVSGGGLAVENALKVAFDWKARKLGRTNFLDDVNDLVILHFKEAFHGRTGYTMSLTNTLPDKVGLFPKFDWPRVHNPGIVFDLDGNVANDIAAEEAKAIDEIKSAFQAYKGRVAGIIIEPMQGEGGDKHFRPEFFQALRTFADEEEALLIFDEVQTGFFGSGKPWLWQHKGVKPDVVSFGKKTQVCGVYAGPRVEEVEHHVFEKSSRINSTWGGNLVDMVRCRKFIEIIRDENVVENVQVIGDRTIEGLRTIAKDTGAFTNVRGVGSLIAFSFDSAESRDAMVSELYEHLVIALPCGTNSVRFRLPLNASTEEVDELLARTATSANALCATP